MVYNICVRIDIHEDSLSALFQHTDNSVNIKPALYK